MSINDIIVVVATLMLLFASITSRQSQLRSSHGVVEKAGPAFSWLKKLGQAELAIVDKRCQHGGTEAVGFVGVASNSTAYKNVSRHRPFDERIIGGQLAGVGQFPYAVALGDSYSYTATCGATLITPRHVLTAAHCVLSDMSQQAAIINQSASLGGVCYYVSPEDRCAEQDVFEVEVELAVKVYYSYSVRDTRRWDQKRLQEPADLALIQLSEPIDSRLFEPGRVHHACLPPPPSNPLPESLHNIGWGRHSDAKGGHHSAHLRFVQLLTRPRDEWSPNVRHLRGCQTSRAYPRFCQYPPGRDPASTYSGDSGSGALARSGSDGGSAANADVLYGVLASGASISYSVNESDLREPYARRMLGIDVSVQHHLDDLCYYLKLGCGVAGGTGVDSTLRLSSFYLKRKRSEMSTIEPFATLSDEQSPTGHDTPERAVAALVDAGSRRKGTMVCVAIAISSRHLVTARKCIMHRYLRVWNGQKIGGGIVSVNSCVSDTPSHQCIKNVEFIAWQRTTVVASRRQQDAAGSDLVIIQLASDEN